MAEASAGLVRDAVLRELDRGGQVFFVHNRVETIEAQAEQLRRLLPRARIVVLLIHDFSQSHPKTLGGSSRTWPMLWMASAAVVLPKMRSLPFGFMPRSLRVLTTWSIGHFTDFLVPGAGASAVA